MKVKQRKSWMPLKRYIYSQFENGIVGEWSLERNTIYFVDGQELHNPNVKCCQSTPVTATDWTDAFKWNAKNHVFMDFLQLNDDSNESYSTHNLVK